MAAEVERTLVKSPPELWAELSNPASLARHLGELGPIRILRTDPERTVEWAAPHLAGEIHLKPSGWGTRVTLTLAHDAPAEAPADPIAPDTLAVDPGDHPLDVLAQEVAAAPPAGVPAVAEVSPEAKPSSAVDSALAAPSPDTQPTAAESEPAPRLGLFARLFRRRRQTLVAEPTSIEESHTAEPTADGAAIDETVAEEAVAEATTATEPVVAAESETPREPSAESLATRETADGLTEERATEVLVTVLDRLGAAHHRPFSRA
jgi:hypothetical protein